MIEVSNVSKHFGQNTVLDDVSLVVPDGKVVAVIGRSGAGKSTILRCINGLEPIQAGEIRLDGMLVGGSRKHVRELRKHVGMVFQSFNLFPHMTALRNVALAPQIVLRKTRREAERTAEELLEKVGLGSKLGRLPSELSGGEQQRVAIARALAMSPSAMLFDEPTSSLDPELVGEVQEVIAALAKDGMTMMIATHGMGFARSIAHEVAVMDRGTIIEIGPPDVIFTKPAHERTQALLRTILSDE